MTDPRTLRYKVHGSKPLNTLLWDNTGPFSPSKLSGPCSRVSCRSCQVWFAESNLTTPGARSPKMLSTQGLVLSDLEVEFLLLLLLLLLFGRPPTLLFSNLEGICQPRDYGWVGFDAPRAASIEEDDGDWVD